MSSIFFIRLSVRSAGRFPRKGSVPNAGKRSSMSENRAVCAAGSRSGMRPGNTAGTVKHVVRSLTRDTGCGFTGNLFPARYIGLSIRTKEIGEGFLPWNLQSIMKDRSGRGE